MMKVQNREEKQIAAGFLILIVGFKRCIVLPVDAEQLPHDLGVFFTHMVLVNEIIGCYFAKYSGSLDVSILLSLSCCFNLIARMNQGSIKVIIR